MSCQKCKKKQMNEQFEKEVSEMERWVLLTLTLIGIAAVYGIFTLITKLL
jgi:hypothetical protein